MSGDAKQKVEDEALELVTRQAPTVAGATHSETGMNDEQEEFLRVLKQLTIAAAPSRVAKNSKQLEGPKEHKFWSTQPVPQEKKDLETKNGDAATTLAVSLVGTDTNEKDEAIVVNGPIEEDKRPEDVRSEPYSMPPGFVWCEMDLTSHAEAQEVYELLHKNYVEDDDNMFRFDYSLDFLQWALQPPCFKKQWHVGVRNEKTHKLMAFISGIPAEIQVYGTVRAMAEVNFLCVHKKLRSKRLAPVLIKEITRRVNKEGIWQAVYTAGVVLPTPIAQCRYYHRSLNPKKLIEVGFSRLPPRMTMTRTIKYYKLPDKPLIAGFRPMEEKDVQAVTQLLSAYLAKFKIAPVFSQAEVAHFMLPRQGVLNSYVVEQPGTQEITDLCSFYHLPSTVIGNEKYKTLSAAYSFYNVATSVSFENLMNDCLIMAKALHFDVFNALNLMDNWEFIEHLKFGKGDGELQYYLYNWMCPQMKPGEVGTVLC